MGVSRHTDEETAVITEARAEACRRVKRDLLDKVSHGSVVVGTIDALCRELGVTTTELRGVLRELLEVRVIAVSAESSGRLIIRLERRAATSVPPVPPRPDRRKVKSDIWIL
jgi:hypothetical protein